MRIQKPEMATTIVRDVHEHEVLLSFNSDSDSVAFSDWWEEKGWDAFRDWAGENR